MDAMNMPPTARKVFDELFSWASRHDRDGVHVYALVDMAGIGDDRAAAKALRTFKGAQAISVLGNRGSDAERAVPWLLRANHHADDRWLRATAQWAAHDPCLTWVASPLQPDDLAARLRARAEALLPDDYAVLLRYFDPRVLPVLQHVLTEEQADAWWALGHSWAYLDRAMSLQCMALTLPSADDTLAVPLRLDQAQVDTMLSASEIDRVMPELVREVPDAFLERPTAERIAFTRRCLALADQWNVHPFAHRVMVGVLALKLGENFHQEHQWRPWIERLQQGGMSLVDVIKHATAR